MRVEQTVFPAAPVPRGRDPIFRTRPVSVIRKGDWQLHLYHEEWQLDGVRAKIDSSRAVELYNIRTDIGERDDLSLKNKSKRDELLDAGLIPMRREPANQRV